MNKSLTSMSFIRYVVAYVFIASGLLKLLVSDFTTVFASFGIPFPETVVLLVAITEVICGGFIAFNFHVKNATIPLMVIMIIAFLLTKVPILHSGFFQFAFEARLDIVMLVLLYIVWKGHK